MKNIQNDSLKDDLSKFVENKDNIQSVNKTVFTKSGAFIITIVEQVPLSSTSYVYDTEAERDADLEIVTSMLK